MARTVKDHGEDVPLLKQEAKFVHEYVWNLEGTEGRAYKAYMKAYPKSQSRSARTNSSVLMKMPNIIKAIEIESQKQKEHMARQIEERDEIAKNKLRETLQNLLDTTVADLYDDDGNAVPLSELGEKAQIINGVKKKYDGEGGYDLEYVLIPKEKILDMLCKRFGLYEKEETQVQINMPVVEVVAKIDNIETWNHNANGK